MYMTPHLAKRKDGLCPGFLAPEYGVKKDKPGHASKIHRTNSALLLQIKVHDDVPKQVVELQTMVECINKALKSAKADFGLVHLAFKAEGCMWRMELDPKLGVASENFRIQVLCSASDGVGGVTNYAIETELVPKIPVDPNPLAPSPDGFEEAKEVFDSIAIKVHKPLVRLEFPDFPEGCKGKAFRDVYQLNARVSLFRVTRMRSISFCVLEADTHNNFLFLIPFVSRSLSQARLPPCAEEHIEQRDAKLPLSVFFEKICLLQMMLPYMTR